VKQWIGETSVIANASGGALDIIKNEKNGLLFEQTPEKLLTCMQSLLESKILCETISWNEVQDSLNYSVTSYVDNVCDVLNMGLIT